LSEQPINLLINAGSDQVLAGDVLEEMDLLGFLLPAREDVFDACREHGIAHPIVLNFSQTLSTDRAGTKVLAKILARRLGTLDQVVITCRIVFFAA
jgi:hypothetical protein